MLTHFRWLHQWLCISNIQRVLQMNCLNLSARYWRFIFLIVRKVISLCVNYTWYRIEFYDQLLRLLLRSCPQHNATVVVGYMKLLSIVLTYYPHVIPAPAVISGPLSMHRNYPTSPLVHKSLMKLLEQTTSNHFKVSSEAINLVTSDMMLCKYMLVDYPSEPSKYYLKALIARLVSNKKHWNIIVRELSDTKYDMLLDYY